MSRSVAEITPEDGRSHQVQYLATRLARTPEQRETCQAPSSGRQ